MASLSNNSSKPQANKAQNAGVMSFNFGSLPLLQLAPNNGLFAPQPSSGPQILIYNNAVTAPAAMSTGPVTLGSLNPTPMPVIRLDTNNSLAGASVGNRNVFSHPVSTTAAPQAVLGAPALNSILQNASGLSLTSTPFIQTPPKAASSTPGQQKTRIRRVIHIIRKPTKRKSPLLPPSEAPIVPKTVTAQSADKPLLRRIVPKPVLPGIIAVTSSNSVQSSSTAQSSPSVTSESFNTPLTVLPSSQKVVVFTPGISTVLNQDKTPSVANVSPAVEEPRTLTQELSGNRENQEVYVIIPAASTTDTVSIQAHSEILPPNTFSPSKKGPPPKKTAKTGDKETWGRCLALDCIVREDPNIRICRRTLPLSQPDKAREWLISAGRLDLLSKLESQPESLRYANVCGLHFSDSQYTNPSRKNLIKGAVPALFGSHALTLASYAEKMREGLEWSELSTLQEQNLIYSLPTATRTKTLTRAVKSRQKPLPAGYIVPPAVLMNRELFRYMLRRVWETEEFTDMVLACNGWKRNVHKAVLAAASPYFKKLLSDPMVALVDGPCVIFMEDRSPWELQQLIKYIYEGQVSASKVRILELEAFFKELEIGPTTCIDLPQSALQKNVIEAPSLPFEKSTRVIYGYGAQKESQTTDSAPQPHSGDFDFLEKRLLKDAEEAVIPAKLRRTLEPLESISSEEDSNAAEIDTSGLFDDERDVEVALPDLAMELSEGVSRHDAEKESQSKSEFDMLREKSEATTNPRLATLLHEIYNTRYLSPYLKSLTRKGYPSPKFPDKTAVLSSNPMPKKEQYNFIRAQRQAERRAKMRQQRLEAVNQMMVSDNNPSVQTDETQPLPETNGQENQALTRKIVRRRRTGEKKRLRKAKMTPATVDISGGADHDNSVNASGDVTESENAAVSETQTSSGAKKSSDESRGYICEYCGKFFKSKSNFQMHRKIHLGIYPHTCDLCGKKFRVRRHLKNHLDSHNGVKNYFCEHCGKGFRTKEHLKAHTRIHTGEKPFKCQFCDKSFRVWSGILSHVRTHTKEKPFACTICNMNFASYKSVNEHKLNHTQENSEQRDPSFFYRCNNCLNYYCRPAHVTKHTCESAGQTESGAYACAHCDKHFETEEYAQSHVLHVHDNPVVPVNLTCQTCSTSFVSSFELYRHARDAHIPRSKNFSSSGARQSTDGHYKCPICKQVFEEEEAWEEHKDNHPTENLAYACKTCGKTFAFKQSLNQHELGHLGVKPFACTQCDKSYATKFLLENHVNRIHLNIKPYRCDTCGARFAGYGNFNRHKYRHTDKRRCKICGRVFDSGKDLIEHEKLHATGQLSARNKNKTMRPKGISETEAEAAPTSQVEEFQNVIEEDAFGVDATGSEDFNDSPFYVVLDESHLA